MKKGFTLIELMIYSTILGLFLVVLTSLFISTLDLQLESESTAYVAADGRYMFSRFSFDLGRATSITIPASLGQETNSLQLTIDGDLYTYGLDNGSLVLVHPDGTDALSRADSMVSDLRFLKIGNIDGKHSVQINFTVTNGIQERQYQTTIALR